MSTKKHRKETHRRTKRETRLDFKLYRYYHTRKDAERDMQRMEAKATAICDWSTFFMMNRAARDLPSISIEQVSTSATQATPGDDYQSIIISKPASNTRHEYSREYAQDEGGELYEVRGGLHTADDPENFSQPQPRDTATAPRPSSTADDYIPLKTLNPKTGRLINHPSRSFVHRDTGEVISRRQHLRLQGIIPEIPARERGTYTRVIISYGVETHE